MNKDGNYVCKYKDGNVEFVTSVNEGLDSKNDLYLIINVKNVCNILRRDCEILATRTLTDNQLFRDRGLIKFLSLA